MNITKRGDKYRCEVCIDYERKSKTFTTKKEAVSWGNDMESKGILPNRTLGDAIKKYRPIAEAQKGHQAKLSRLSMLERHPLSALRLESIQKAHISEYKEERLGKVSPSSVRVEMNLIATILRLCRDEWGWMHHDPIKTVKKPLPAPARRRGISQEEIDKILENLSKVRLGKITSQMFLLSLETGMRLGELVSLKWDDVGDKTVTLWDTKNGDKRPVPLSQKARSILSDRRNLDELRVFPVTSHSISQCFKRSSVNGVHFHDARGEAITRLSKKLDVMQLAKMIGHRDLKSLLFYYAEKAEDIAERL